MLDCLGKNVSHVSSHLQHPVFRPGFGQFVQIDLQDESVEALQRHVIEAVDKILLNEQLFHLGGFRFPVRLFQGQKPVPHKPAERDSAVVHDAASRILAALFRDFKFEAFPCLKLRHLRLLAENDGKRFNPLFVVGWIEDRPAVVAVPLLAPQNDPTLLVRFTHFVPQFLWGNKWVSLFYGRNTCEDYWLIVFLALR